MPMPAHEALERIRRATAGVVSLGVALSAVWAGVEFLPARLVGVSLPAELRRSGLAALPLSALLLLAAALSGTLVMARARAAGTAGGEGRAARIPQALLVPAIALPASALAWWLRPEILPPSCPQQTGFLLAGGAAATAFLLLVLERNFAGMTARALPEAPALRSLAFLAAGVTFAIGVIEIVANLGVPNTGFAGVVLAAVLAAAGVEMSLRAMGRLFLPPPAAEGARAAGGSLVARLLSAGAGGPGGMGAPLRQHLGIDFSRSWALAYMRAVSLPMAVFFLLLAWGLSGAVLVGLDGRAVYEAFGAPVRVLHPGLHVGLPWPLGAARAVEFGPVHEIGLGTGGSLVVPRSGAEDAAPASADRLWEQAHPAEVELLVASAAAGRQSFQSVSADLKILYRVGLSDGDALRAAYATADPQAFVRAAAGRVVTRAFAGRTLDDVLGADREAMADGLRSGLQDALDAANTGLQAVAVVIEAIHPPAGAADAYHNVRSAEIAARTSVAVEQGAAATIMAQSKQYAFQQAAAATAAGAETVAAARTASLRFAADRGASAAGGRSFLIERYFGALSAALGHAPKTIIDHRLNWPEAPVLDLRPFAAAAGTGAGKEE